MPVVARPRGGVSNLAIGVGVVAAGLLLFAVLDSRRRETASPAVRVRAADRVQMASPPPPLYVPPAVPEPTLVPVVPVPAAATPVPSPPPPPAPPQIVYVPQPQPYPTAQPYEPPPPPPPPPRVATGPVLVVDVGSAAGAPGAGGPAESAIATPGTAGVAGGRARSGAFANRGTTVAQGTLIPAVLETALDSTRPGLARAIVSRDVRGFDGSRILIPRGSRLIGEYRSEVARTQKRALVNWIRLVRPDGVTIAIGSPASDPLGRAGIKAKVNSHFFERFAGAILQSALDIGVNLASSRVGNGTTVILPTGGLQGTTQIIQPSQVTPTLKVKAGTSISIFAARDLDFSSAENRR
jgi:type IV secretion system protein VirB10